MFGLGIPELMVVFAIVMVFFGGKKLPELATGMGKAVRNFRKASSETGHIEGDPAPRIGKEESDGVQEHREKAQDY